MADALAGIRILDLSQGIAGPLGVLLLAEHGADVIKVEPPGGDPFRSYPGYEVWGRSRRSVVLDLPRDADGLLRLAASADVVVESFRPGVMDRLGLGYEALAAANPHLVMVSCPGYPAGHRMAGRPAYDALVQASSGQMWEQPGWRMGPVFLHLPLPSMGAMYLVASGALAGLAARSVTGGGQHVRTSLLQGALLFTTQIWQEVQRGGAPYHAVMAKTYPPGVHQQMLFECAAGEWLHLSIMSGLTPTASVDDIVGPGGYAAWDRDALVEALRSHHHAAEAVTPAEGILSHPQTIANDTVCSVAGRTQMGVPIHLLGTPGRVRGPLPSLGAHTASVLASAAEIGRPAAPAGRDIRPSGGPLAGVRVLDFGQYLAGPFGPMILADLGADVIKIEPVTGDSMRWAGKPFVGCQRGKRGLALDLKAPGGREVALRLIAGADVVHHNMTRGVATRLGIDYEACRAVRPDIIYCNTYAYGLADPLGGSGGLDPLYQASAGIEYEAGGMPAGNPPLYLRFGMCDASNAMLSVVGVLLAFVHRQRTGEGQELWTSLHDGGLIFSSDVWTSDLGPAGRAVAWDRPHLDAGLHGLSPWYRLYRTQDDGWICVAAVTSGAQTALVEVVGPDLEAGFLTKTALHWHRVLDDAGVPNEIPVDTREGAALLHDGDLERLGLVASYRHPMLGELRQFGSLIDFSSTPSSIDRPPPLVGQHSREVLREAGFSEGEISSLIASGVVAEPGSDYRWPV